jgi:hypothetical protein
MMHEPGCSDWGNLAFFLSDPAGEVRDSMPAYWAARLLTTAWADSAGGEHRQFATTVPREGGARPSSIGAYTLQRPDGRWSVLLLNRDPKSRHSITVTLRTGDASTRRPLRGPFEIWQYSSEQYRFHQQGESGRPSRNKPPTHLVTTSPAPVVLPPMSITVITGH